MSFRESRALAVTLVTAACFTDIVAYSIAVPVLPDLSRRLGASPAIIGLLIGSFGVTLLKVGTASAATPLSNTMFQERESERVITEVSLRDPFLSPIRAACDGVPSCRRWDATRATGVSVSKSKPVSS